MRQLLDNLASWWLVKCRGFVVARTTKEVREALTRMMWEPRERELVGVLETALDRSGGRCVCDLCFLVAARRSLRKAART